MWSERHNERRSCVISCGLENSTLKGNSESITSYGLNMVPYFYSTNYLKLNLVVQIRFVEHESYYKFMFQLYFLLMNLDFMGQKFSNLIVCRCEVPNSSWASVVECSLNHRLREDQTARRWTLMIIKFLKFCSTNSIPRRCDSFKNSCCCYFLLINLNSTELNI